MARGGGARGLDFEFLIDAAGDAAAAHHADVFGEHGSADRAVAGGDLLVGEGFFGHGLS